MASLCRQDPMPIMIIRADLELCLQWNFTRCGWCAYTFRYDEIQHRSTPPLCKVCTNEMEKEYSEWTEHMNEEWEGRNFLFIILVLIASSIYIYICIFIFLEGSLCLSSIYIGIFFIHQVAVQHLRNDGTRY